MQLNQVIDLEVIPISKSDLNDKTLGVLGMIINLIDENIYNAFIKYNTRKGMWP